METTEYSANKDACQTLVTAKYQETDQSYIVLPGLLYNVKLDIEIEFSRRHVIISNRGQVRGQAIGSRGGHICGGAGWVRGEVRGGGGWRSARGEDGGWVRGPNRGGGHCVRGS
ncbi:hypothetical protein NQD34_014711 [Periophthalmus magnuspinnatus]|nr:hypothetical protein NQD34_014711 [Periophthalmus magnuspinnatus]